MACRTSSCDYSVTSLAISLFSTAPKFDELLGVDEEVLLGLDFLPFLS